MGPFSFKPTQIRFNVAVILNSVMALRAPVNTSDADRGRGLVCLAFLELYGFE